MGKREEEIENIIRNTVFTKYFPLNTDEGNKKGRDILYKLYLKDYNYLDTIHTRRLILYNLIYAERKLNNEDAVAKYAIQLKDDMDNIQNYKNEFTGDYCNMLSYYCDCKYIKLTKEEMLEHYNFCYEYFKTSYDIDRSIDTYIRMVNMKFNISRIQKNFSEVLDIIKDIHNINHPQATSIIEQMLCDIKKLDEQLYDEALEIVNSASLIACI